MSTLLTLAVAMSLSNPWQIGPAPSAHPTTQGYNVGADVGGAVGGLSPIWGARAAAAVTPHPSVWTSLELGYGTAWRPCIDCRSLGVTWTLRGLALRHKNVSLGGWSMLTTVNGLVEWMPGVALEAGTARVRLDTSWPIWSTYDLLTTLRATPEVGLSVIINPRHSLRIAALGLEPAGALSYRFSMDNWVLSATVRGGEEGVGLELGFRFRSSW